MHHISIAALLFLISGSTSLCHTTAYKTCSLALSESFDLVADCSGTPFDARCEVTRTDANMHINNTVHMHQFVLSVATQQLTNTFLTRHYNDTSNTGGT
jgi:hypothetical protein